MPLPIVTDATFDAEVLGATVPVVVDFMGDHCPPCKEVSRALEALAPDYPELCIVAVDIVEATTAASRFGVTSMMPRCCRPAAGPAALRSAGPAANLPRGGTRASRAAACRPLGLRPPWIPKVRSFRGGELVDKLAGAAPERRLRALLDAAAEQP